METRSWSSSSIARSKEKDPEIVLSINEVVEPAPTLYQVSVLKRYTNWLDAWMNSQGLEVHGLVSQSCE